jgi:hypothetical protein
MATTTQGGSSAQASLQQAQQANMMARQMITQQAVDLTQQIFTQTITNYSSGVSYPINVKLNNVGLVKRLWVEVTATITDGSSATGMTLTEFGPANMLSQVVLTDTSNQVRIQTAGWHLHNVATARRKSIFGAAYATSDSTGVGNNLPVQRAVNVAPGGNDGGVFQFFYEIPVSYSDTDLTGAIWMNVVNATANLQLVINPNFFISSTAADATGAVYQMNSGATTNLGVITTMTVTVYQNALDQIPVNPQTGAFILPTLDLQYALLLLNTSTTGFTTGLDQAIPYANFRQFVSTFVMYDNGGVLNPGTDINYIALQSANMTNYFKVDPLLCTLLTRNMIGDDFPTGLYYIDTRNQPINTMQYGNRQLIINPKGTVNANANFQIGYEAIAPLGVTNSAGSIYQT